MATVPPTPAIPASSAGVIERYLKAKDAQVPLLYDRVFVAEGRFESRFEVPSPFPPSEPCEGIEAIRANFQAMGTMVENVVTFVPVESATQEGSLLRARWVVAMTRRDGQGGFVGWGSYRWELTDSGHLARELKVAFEGLSPIEAGQEAEIFGPLFDLSHPWCEEETLRAAAARARIPGLQAWLRSPSGPA